MTFLKAPFRPGLSLFLPTDRKEPQAAIRREEVGKAGLLVRHRLVPKGTLPGTEMAGRMPGPKMPAMPCRKGIPWRSRSPSFFHANRPGKFPRGRCRSDAAGRLFLPASFSGNGPSCGSHFLGGYPFRRHGAMNHGSHSQPQTDKPFPSGARKPLPLPPECIIQRDENRRRNFVQADYSAMKAISLH